MQKAFHVFSLFLAIAGEGFFHCYPAVYFLAIHHPVFGNHIFMSVSLMAGLANKRITCSSKSCFFSCIFYFTNFFGQKSQKLDQNRIWLEFRNDCVASPNMDFIDVKC